MKLESISPKEVEHIIDNDEYAIVDVREYKYYRRGHVKGAISIPIEEIVAKSKQLDKDKTIIVYCDKGSASLLATRELMKLGFKVLSMGGGLRFFKGRLYR